jgi:hypothetical protein
MRTLAATAGGRNRYSSYRIVNSNLPLPRRNCKASQTINAKTLPRATPVPAASLIVGTSVAHSKAAPCLRDYRDRTAHTMAIPASPSALTPGPPAPPSAATAGAGDAPGRWATSQTKPRRFGSSSPCSAVKLQPGPRASHLMGYPWMVSDSFGQLVHVRGRQPCRKDGDAGEELQSRSGTADRAVGENRGTPKYRFAGLACQSLVSRPRTDCYCVRGRRCALAGSRPIWYRRFRSSPNAGVGNRWRWLHRKPCR